MNILQHHTGGRTPPGAAPMGQTRRLCAAAAFAVVVVFLGNPLYLYNGCVAPDFYTGEPYGKCEGYWSDEHPPVPHARPWCGKAEFVEKLASIEARAVEGDGAAAGARFILGRQRGLATSRIDGSFLGNEEYYDMAKEVCWTGDFRSHYVAEHNVVPSLSFYKYVQGVDHASP